MIVHIYEATGDDNFELLRKYNTDVRSCTVPRVGEEIVLAVTGYEVIHVMYPFISNMPSASVITRKREFRGPRPPEQEG